MPRGKQNPISDLEIDAEIKRLVHERGQRPTAPDLTRALQAQGHQVARDKVRERLAGLRATGEIEPPRDKRLDRIMARRAEVLAFYDQGLTTNEIAARLGAPYRTVAADLVDLRAEGALPAEPKQAPREDALVETATGALVRAQRASDRAAARGRELRTVARTESAMERLLEEVKAQPWAPPKPFKLAKGRAARGKRYYVLHLTDWHLSETVDGRIVGGFNEYGSVIATTRIQSAVEQAMQIIAEREQCGYETAGLLQLHGGDAVPGLIHGLDRHADRDIMSAVAHGGALAAAIAHDLLRLVPADKTSLLFLTGNHGRLRHDEAHQNLQCVRESYDWMMGVVARGILSNTGLRIRLAESLYERFRINGREYLALHGDLMGAGKSPGDRAIKTMKDLSHLWGVKISGVFGGHYHHPLMLGDRAYFTGSPKGRDGYAHMLGVGDEAPSQTLYEMDEQGRVLSHILYCDRPVAELRYPTHGDAPQNTEDTPAGFVLDVA